MAESLITQHIDLWTSAIEVKSTAGRGSKNKFDLYGIKKLRELILELAVRGKLVPQDPRDEPASVLLEKIAVEKNYLIKEGKIRKAKNLPKIEKNEWPFELPCGWDFSRLNTILTKITDGTHHSPPNKDTGDYLYISAKNIKNEGVQIANATYVTTAVHQDIYTRCNPELGDILYIKDGATTGVVTINDIDEPFSMLSSVALLKCPSLLFNKYLLLSLRSPFFYNEMRAGMTGVAITRVTLKKLENSFIPVPPLAEQQRIFAKVDELMVLCDQLEQQTLTSIDAHATLVETLLETLTNSADAAELEQNWARISEHFDTLFTTEQSIDALKQTILQLAVMGKLVRQDPTDEPASVLLEKIAAEKAQLIKDKKIKKEKPLLPISDDEKLFELPLGWEWCRLNDFTLSSEAGWSPQCDSNPRIGENWGVLKVSAVTWGKFKSEENKALPQELNPKTQYEIEIGDFLISRANTADLVAKSVVVPMDAPNHLMMSDKIIRFKFSDRINAEYINLVNNSLFARNYYALVAGGTSSSMKNVSRDQIRNLVIALPSKKEASLILEKYNELLNVCEKIKLNLQICNQTNLRITDAIVDNALN
ncbi:restriction endonuclease subunit S [uncultured Tolumonas sp.]|uniref:restriction endonuclease subunit S n=1 Tax=uncultured Tolumonas sp. TaxID=263765 RepID=UPI002A0A15C6|nr:restriction endonuclease subunit S [uncultured Tolumonas sp.]